VRIAAGQPVTVGIRPEHVAPCAPRDAAVAGEVEMVEQLGADALVHVAHGNGALIARVPHGTHPEVGAPFGMCVEPARVFVFDSKSGSRIRA
jgi:ABC-type sugar transport system ATPase subunit